MLIDVPATQPARLVNPYPNRAFACSRCGYAEQLLAMVWCSCAEGQHAVRMCCCCRALTVECAALPREPVRLALWREVDALARTNARCRGAVAPRRWHHSRVAGGR